jgi:anti-sigma factor RsiW
VRRLIDEPDGVADTDRQHIAHCPVCRSTIATARQDAQRVRAALDVEVAPDIDAAWQRMMMNPGKRPNRIAGRRALRSPIVAGAAAAVLLAGAGAAAAANWLPIFHTQQVVPITVTQEDLVKLPDLSAYGTVKITKRPDIRDAPDAAAAQKATGLAVPQVARPPRGVSGQPTYKIGDQLAATFTFSTEKAGNAAKAAGKPLPPPPAGLDGTEFRMTAGPGLAEVWTESRGVPAMIVARVVAPTGYSPGVPFATVRDYLLSMPGLPEAVASQLRAFTGDGTTLPFVVKAGKQTASTADVGGHPATVLTTRDGVMAGVVWVDRGVLTAVAGSLSADEVLEVARELR